MHRQSFALLALTALLLLCGPSAARASERPCPLTATDSAAVVKTIQTMYEGAAHGDSAAFHAVLEPDFYAFDGGQAFAGDALWQMVRGYQAKGYVFVWSVTDPHVDGTCDLAWIRFTNRGSVADAKGKEDVTWLESAVLRKEPGGWKVAFFHSTRKPKPQ